MLRSRVVLPPFTSIGNGGNGPHTKTGPGKDDEAVNVKENASEEDSPYGCPSVDNHRLNGGEQQETNDIREEGEVEEGEASDSDKDNSIMSKTSRSSSNHKHKHRCKKHQRSHGAERRNFSLKRTSVEEVKRQDDPHSVQHDKQLESRSTDIPPPPELLAEHPLFPPSPSLSSSSSDANDEEEDDNFFGDRGEDDFFGRKTGLSDSSSWKEVFSKRTSVDREGYKRQHRKRNMVNNQERKRHRSKEGEKSRDDKRKKAKKSSKDKNNGRNSWYDLPSSELTPSDPKKASVKNWIETCVSSSTSEFKVPAIPPARTPSSCRSTSSSRDKNKEKDRCDKSTSRDHRHSDERKRCKSSPRESLSSSRDRDYDLCDAHERDHHGCSSSRRSKDDDDYYYYCRSRDDRGRDDGYYYYRHDRYDPRDDYFRDRDYRAQSRDRSSSRSVRSISRARRIYTQEEKIDRDKLLAIARANLAEMIRKGTLPKGIDVDRFKLRHLKELATSKTVQEYTEFCRAISAMEAAAYSDSSLSGSDDSDDEVRSVISEVTFAGRHPFTMKERKDITINVRDFVNRTPRTAKEIQEEMRQEFPVSSGDKHRQKEMEWQEVVETVPPPTTLPSKSSKKSGSSSSKSKEQPDDSLLFAKAGTDATNFDDLEQQVNVDNVVVFDSPLKKTFDVGSIVAQRLAAMKVLQTDPYNMVALKQLKEAQEQMEEWSKSCATPGTFTGSTGANPLPREDLDSRIGSVWATPDCLKNTKAIDGGIGKHLLKMMGWQEGQGLGKNCQGSLTPVLPSVKLDTKGLYTEGETFKPLALQVVQDQNNKPPALIVDLRTYPVTHLHSFCLRKKYPVPVYEIVEESGPPHKRQFVQRVLVNGIWYQPTVTSSTKKHAKHLAATVCLQAFGLLPKDPPKIKLRMDMAGESDSQQS